MAVVDPRYRVVTRRGVPPPGPTRYRAGNPAGLTAEYTISGGHPAHENRSNRGPVMEKPPCVSRLIVGSGDADPAALAVTLASYSRHKSPSDCPYTRLNAADAKYGTRRAVASASVASVSAPNRSARYW